ncbi:hypothetical protein 2 [Wuchan romanomermis nematode virus 3]|uniref:hypothetical protein 2 n=1 Tax=Wuchan romanomermis nematode virus 3 TaxID=1923687 RepID=UPI00090B58DA|nr:hypothetical protein 2 [Wuchan romanomermis nematode virus 3]APG75890.1 hypothetical protein 2 [Wuchan romanomermis nematode virus 3]
MREAPTIGKWLKWELDHPDPIQACRLWIMVQQVFAGTYDHYFRVFVKDEPHKIAKAREGRWRLIIASSLPVQVAWNMAFRAMNDLLIKKVYRTPALQGLILCYGGWKRFLAYAQTNNWTMSKDMSGWDVNAPGWVFDADLELRTRLCSNPSASWIRLVRMLYDDAFRDAKLLFSNGLVYQQQFSGFMKSGVYNTISTNSNCMFFLHVIASRRARIPLRPIGAVGDDTIQSPFPDAYIDHLQSLGCVVKEQNVGLEFIGTDFRSGEPRPMYFDKHLVSICNTEDVPSTLDSFCRLYAHEPDKLAFWLELGRQLGVSLRSSAYYQFWYDSPWARMLEW